MLRSKENKNVILDFIILIILLLAFFSIYSYWSNPSQQFINANLSGSNDIFWLCLFYLLIIPLIWIYELYDCINVENIIIIFIIFLIDIILTIYIAYSFYILADINFTNFLIKLIVFYSIFSVLIATALNKKNITIALITTFFLVLFSVYTLSIY